MNPASATDSSPVSSHPGRSAGPLCVDLDGTLVCTDTLHESLLLLLRQRPLTFLMALGAIGRGRAAFKAQVCRHAAIDPAALPYNQQLLELIRAERNSRRPVWLVTAADRSIAQRVATHLGIFDRVIASDGQTNCKGEHKLQLILDQLRSSGGPEPLAFDYAGDASADLPLFRASGTPILVGPKARKAWDGQGHKTHAQAIRLDTPALTTTTLLKAVRVHQWAKNVLLFVPLLAAHEADDLRKLLMLVFAFIAFSLTASSVYLVNDLLDLESDRHHRLKRHRPLASGAMSIPLCLALVVLLLFTATAFAYPLPPQFQLLLGLYVILTTAYSFYLKRKLLVDVIVLAGLYTHRIFAGGSATGIVVSTWLLTFSMFLFASLAFLKRFVELRFHDQEVSAQADALDPLEAGKSSGHLSGRGYRSEDSAITAVAGLACGTVSVLVLALYISSDVAQRTYHRQLLLWGICPLVLYWITRLWFLGNRGAVHEDPVVFAMKDRVGWIVVLACAGLAMAASM